MAEKKNYDFVDALRGWAILGVIAFHVNLFKDPSVELFRNIFAKGDRGVQLFFIVSIFTLFLSFHSRAQDEHKPVRNFFIRRFFRIVPLFYFVIVFCSVFYGTSFRLFAVNGPGLFNTMATVLFLHAWYPTSMNSVVSGDWSLGIEMNIYILLPLLFTLITDLEKAIFATFISVAFGIVLNDFVAQHFLSIYPQNTVPLASFLFFWLPSQLSIFCLGIIFYFMFKRISLDRSKNWFKSLAYLGIALIWLAQVSMVKDFFLPEYFLFSLGLLIFAYSLALYPHVFFVNRLTTSIGKWSYSMYLLHFIVLDFLQRIFPEFNILPSNTLNFFLFLFLVISVTALVSVVTYLVIEKPSIRFGQKIITRLAWKRPGCRPVKLLILSAISMRFRA